MQPNAIFEWEGTEYRFEDKSADWYWALGIIATAIAIAAVLFNNILLALLEPALSGYGAFLTPEEGERAIGRLRRLLGRPAAGPVGGPRTPAC